VRRNLTFVLLTLASFACTIHVHFEGEAHIVLDLPDGQCLSYFELDGLPVVYDAGCAVDAHEDAAD
jgi:hypothetical protein